MTLVKEQCILDIRKYSFSQKKINEWNKLPNDCELLFSVNPRKLYSRGASKEKVECDVWKIFYSSYMTTC